MREHRPWPDDLSLRDARQRFFVSYGIGDDGDYDAPWQEAQFGPLRYRVPNGPWRARVLRRHDLHHLVTGYAADWRGESQISAWELGAGLGPFSYAWVIALWGLFVGLLLWPAEMARAFRRGRRMRSLYTAPDPDLQGTVADLRRQLVHGQRWEWMDRPALALWSMVAMVFGVLSIVPAALFVAGASTRGCPFRPAHCTG